MSQFFFEGGGGEGGRSRSYSGFKKCPEFLRSTIFTVFSWSYYLITIIIMAAKMLKKQYSGKVSMEIVSCFGRDPFINFRIIVNTDK